LEIDLNILAIYSGEYGRRHIENARKTGPQSWQIRTWQHPKVLPPILDYPEDYMPDDFAPADLILSFAEHRAVAEMLPEMAKMTGAKGIVAAIDNENWLPIGLARQLIGWLADLDVVCVTPKPLCSLTETDYAVSVKERVTYNSKPIAAFARLFGQPELELEVDPDTKKISRASVKRDAVCGCARFVAENLVGVKVVDAEEKAGLLHHHFPCMASMHKIKAYNMDTLMHASGHLLRKNVKEQLKNHIQVRYFNPGNRSE
jgi:hypothetical protein